MKFLMTVAVLLSMQVAHAESNVIYSVKGNEDVSASFVANPKSAEAYVKVTTVKRRTVTPRNIPANIRKSVKIPVEGLTMSGNDLVFENVTCGTVKKVSPVGPRGGIARERLVFSGNCGLSILKTVAGREKSSEVILKIKR